MGQGVRHQQPSVPPQKQGAGRFPLPTMIEGNKWLNIAKGSRDAYLKHIKKWRPCDDCVLCASRKQMVAFRGTMPCDVLFIGEAPGQSEDHLGYPFVGEAGDLFDKLLPKAFALRKQQMLNTLPGPPNNGKEWFTPPTYGVTNIVGCIPLKDRDEFSSGTIREPEREEAKACKPRLLEIINMCKPRMIILMGKSAERFMPSVEELGIRPPKIRELVHPSAILRIERAAVQALAEKRFFTNLAGFISELHNA